MARQKTWARAHLTGLAVATCLLAACQTELYTKLNEREANEIVAVLSSAGITASRLVTSPTEVSVSVDKGNFAKAIDILESRGLPRKAYANLSDVFAGEGFVVSPTEERARLIFAISEELSHTLSEIDGVLSARVHAVLPSEEIIGKAGEPASASVFLRHVESADLRDMVPEIKVLVANSIEGLRYDNVSVFLVKSVPSPIAAPPLVASNLQGGPTSVWFFLAAFLGVLIPGGIGLAVLRRKALKASTPVPEPAALGLAVIADARTIHTAQDAAR